MGLLSRIGKNVSQQFPDTWAGRAPMEGLVPSALMGATIGGIGAASMPGNINGEGMTAGAGLGALAGAAIPGGFAVKRLVVGIAQALKRQHPEVPDEMILQKAMEMAQTQGDQAGGMTPPMGGMPPGGGMGGM